METSQILYLILPKFRKFLALSAAGGDIVAFVDGDLREFSAQFVTGLLGPLLVDRSVEFVKGFYHRPLVGAAGLETDGGGRVTELCARPLINLCWPELAGFVQPLAGEYAGRRTTLERIPFVCSSTSSHRPRPAGSSTAC